jgi:hypothetical protein
MPASLFFYEHEVSKTQSTQALFGCGEEMKHKKGDSRKRHFLATILLGLAGGQYGMRTKFISGNNKTGMLPT